ncbi:MAG: histidine ammonia-lyase [Candidatus Aminicenantes bacterium]|nr:histidine ammonia-lyase [Candidatus Aminicenantes bacterium]
MILLDGETLTLDQVVKVARFLEKVDIHEGNKALVEQSAETVNRFLKRNKVVYGITTGFGNFADVVIPKNQVRALQKNLLMSHATGTGPFIRDEQVRAMMVLRINALIKGYSGIRWPTLQRLLLFLNRNILPLIPQKGSVGASGDLVPLAHMSLPLIGIGKVKYKGKNQDAATVLRELSLKPLVLEAKEGLALINGTQMMTAVGVLNAYDGLVLCRTADIAGAASVEALRGTDTPFDPRVQGLRPHKGQTNVAGNMLKLMKGSRILKSHAECSKVQDAYSLRCIPQVHGATRDTLDHVDHVLLTEINSVTDNPIIFFETDESISCGNFHGQPIALVLDFLGIGLSELASISERRIERLVDPALSNLPPFLTKEGGLNSGYMISQYAAAALVSENKVLSHPASVDSIPTSANQEDHVSMGTIAAFKGAEIINNVRSVLAIELLCASQGLDFIDESPGQGVRIAHEKIRKFIPTLTQDRVMSYDLKAMEKLIFNESVLKSVESVIGKL